MLFRSGEHPLTNADMWQDIIDPIRSARGHSAPTARRTETAAATGKWHQTVVIAVVTLQPGKAVGWVTTDLETLELSVDKPGQSAARSLELVIEDGQALTNDLMEPIAGRSARLEGGGHDAEAKQDPSQRDNGRYQPIW